MSPPKRETTVTGRYDQALHYARDQRLPHGYKVPCPTCQWPPENVAFLERFAQWLAGGGASEYVIRTVYIPMAGHVLGLFLQPHPRLNPDTDLQPALDYVLAKGSGPDWVKVCHMALERFRRFLLNDRGLVQIQQKPYDLGQHTAGLPDWLVSELVCWQRIRSRNWRPARLEQNIRRFWSGHLRLWRFLCRECRVRELTDLKRNHLLNYIDQRLKEGSAVRTINNELRCLHGFLAFLQQQGYPVAQSLLRSPCLKEPDALPRFLPDDQVNALQEDLADRVQSARTRKEQREALLDRACFYLLWQGGMRKGEVEELRLEDLDLPGRRLTVRRGKGLKDRTVYLTERAAQAVNEYLPVRGMGPTDHVFLYRNQALSKDLIHGRLQLAGNRVGVKVTAHQLRHTCATQLLNAGCRVTSIQKFLGHKKLNSTMIYARVHDQTVAEDYYAAMGSVERRLALAEDEKQPGRLQESEREQVLAIAAQLAQPEVSHENRLDLAEQICLILAGTRQPSSVFKINEPEMILAEHPPPGWRR